MILTDYCSCSYLMMTVFTWSNVYICYCCLVFYSEKWLTVFCHLVSPTWRKLWRNNPRFNRTIEGCKPCLVCVCVYVSVWLWWIYYLAFNRLFVGIYKCANRFCMCFHIFLHCIVRHRFLLLNDCSTYSYREWP